MSPFWSVSRVNRLSLLPPLFEPSSLAETTPVAEPATLPSIEDIDRASAFTREPFLTEGEDAASALAPGTPRRRALDSALEELEAGAKVPTPHWRRQWSLLLGPGPPALAGRAAPGRRHRPLRPPGRRALGHADRAARRSPQERRRPAAPRSPSPCSTPTTRCRSSSTTTTTRTTRKRKSRGSGRRTRPRPRTSPRRLRTPTPASASGSSTRPAPARPSPPSASSRPRAPAAS